VDSGSSMRLTNALQLTDGRPGDILILVNIKAEPEQPFSGGVVAVNTENFENEVVKSTLPVVVDFWAQWCGPCRIMSPVFEKVADQYQGRFKFCKLNVDENPGLAGHFQATSIPALLVFINGQTVERSIGAIPESQLKAKLDAILQAQL
jgi:thioredoxin 1